jgi:NADPH2:quinone reductase
VPAFIDREPYNTGDDIAGYVHKVGKNVVDFKQGDRVAAFHVMQSSNGSFAEYAIAPSYTTFPLPPNLSFEQGATYPLAAMTAAIGLFVKLDHLPTPLSPAKEGEENPLVIYGGSSAVGAFAIKLAKLANIHPIITVAGSSGDFAKSIGADIVVDYRQGDVSEGLKKALGGKQLLGAYDAISEKDSVNHLADVVQPGGKIVTVLPTPTPSSNITVERMSVGESHDGSPYVRDFASAYFRLFTRWAEQGRFDPHPHEVIPGGLSGVEEGLRRLQQGKVNAKKLVFRIEETPGIERS